MGKMSVIEERRAFLRRIGRWLMAASLGVVGWAVGRKAKCGRGDECGECPELDGCRLPESKHFRSRIRSGSTVWQLDPHKCVQCGRCATDCVLTPSAVKCVHRFALCGYCKLCFGYFRPAAKELTENAENQMCPTGAIRRKFVEDPFHEYTIDKSLCIGCGKCVKGCMDFGNGSLFLQVDHDLCLNCNDCSIARNCPADAYSRVPASTPYIIKT